MNSCKLKPCDNRKCTSYQNGHTTNNNVFTSAIAVSNNLVPFDEESQVQEFYKDGKILITGGTGFVGKALAEKLLRTCVNVSTIFILVRAKRSQTAEERFQKLLDSSVFDRIRMEKDAERILSKLVCVSGDITSTDVGLSEEVSNKMLDEVTIVFHSAATVKFNESLETAMTLNTIGTQRVLLFCRKMKQLKAFIHVSTAYSNADKADILETVYPISANILGDIKSSDMLSADLLERIGRKLQKKHPNTYTVTKAMAEWLVSKYSDGMPVAIVRPSIVTAAWREPFEGWVDNVCGVTGIMMEIGRGTIRSVICDQRFVVDIIPVDLVVNSLLAVAWYTATYRYNSINVYNCTSGAVNPLTWEELGALTRYYSLKAPSKYIQWYPGLTFRTNRFMHLLCDMMFHFFPAFLMDTLLRLTGSKPVMLKIYNRFKLAAKTGEFFALHQWNFKSENLQVLQQSMDCPSDKETFNVDISTLNWDMYMKNYVLGIRKYVLKDPAETIPHARKKLYRLYWVHTTLQVLMAALIFQLIRSLI